MAIRYPTNYNSTADLPADLEDMAASIQEELDQKVDKVTGKGLSTNDYTTNEKNKLAGIEAQANKTVVDSSLSSSSTNPVQNKKVKEALDTKENTSNKVTSISSSSTNTQYPSAKLLYDKLAEKQEQIDALVEENSTLKKQQLKGQASGSSIQLTDSAEGLEIENVVLKGTTSQNTYNGYNLLNPYLINQTVNGVTVSYDSETQIITLNGTCTADNVRFSFNSENIELPANTNLYGLIKYVSGSSEGYFGLRTFVKDWTNNLIVESTTGINADTSLSKNFNSDKIFSNFDIRVNSDSVFNNLKIKVMFSKENIDYEPFCGAQVSPNKDYPQEVHCVTGDCNVRVTNKNLFNKNNANVVNGLLSDSGKFQSNSYENAIIFNANPNVTYTISRNANNHSFFRVAETSQYPNFGIEYKNRIKQDNTSKITYTTSDSAKYLIINFYSNTDENITLTEMLDSIQIEKNTTNTEYVTSQEQNAPLSLGTIGLYDGDKIQISFINKAGYKKVTGASIIKKWKSGVINGSETIQLMDTLTNTIRYAVNNVLNPKALQFGKVYSNYLICYDSQRSNYNFNNSANDIEAIHIRDDQFGLGLKIKKTTASTVEGLKTWLQSHNLNYTYELETPETTPITDPTLLSQLETLINMKTYKQITNIETTGSDLAPVLEFQYSKDLQTVIDSINARLELVEN